MAYIQETETGKGGKIMKLYLVRIMADVNGWSKSIKVIEAEEFNNTFRWSEKGRKRYVHRNRLGDIHSVLVPSHRYFHGQVYCVEKHLEIAQKDMVDYILQQIIKAVNEINQVVGHIPTGFSDEWVTELPVAEK